jgi:acetolactate synthase-1/2/3 large subunit
MSGGQTVVRSLVREGVDVIFGLPGVQMYGIIDALREEPGIRMITARHEGTTTYMADGYARATGKPGVALVVPGPGIYNAAAGLSTAYSRSSQVLMIAGQIPRATIGKDLGGLHEVNDQIDSIKPVTKWQKRVFRPHEVPGGLHEAFRQMRTGRPRPVEFELPPEAMVEVEDVDLVEPAPADRSVPSQGLLTEAAKLIVNAKSPVIYAGGGVARSNAEAELVAFAEATNIPVITSAGGKSTISDLHPLSLGSSLGPAGLVKDVMNNADVVIGIGTRFSLRNPAGNGSKMVHIDADPAMIGKIHKNTLGLQGDAKATMAALQVECVKLGAGKRLSPAARIKEIKDTLRNSEEEHDEPQHSLLMSVRDGAPDDAIMVFGMTQLGYYSRLHWPVYGPKSYIDSGYSGNLGFAFPTALGAKVGQPDRPVICISGDGGFGYYLTELSTAMKYGINLVTVVFNDNAFGNVARDLDQDFGGQYEAALHNPDFMKLADAYGVVGMRTDKPTDVGDLIARAVKLNKPALIEVPVQRMPRPKMMTARAPWTRPQTGLIQD